MRWTFKEAKTYVADVPMLNLCEDDPRIDAIINRAQEYAVIHSRGEVLHQRIAICVDNNCIVWPRQVASVTDMSLCSQVIPLRNQWYEFLQDGVGVYVGQGTCESAGHDRGDVCSFADIRGTNKKLKLYLDVSEDAGKYLWAYGLNQNGIWLRTDIDGEIRDGERIPLVQGQISQNFFQALQRTRKDVTKGRVMVYEVDTVTLLERPLAIYEPDEVNPVYRTTLLRGAGRCPGAGCGGKATVVAMVKLEFIPAKHDDDLMLVPSRTALRFLVSAMLKFDNSQEQTGLALANLGMAEMGYYRDHKSPREQIAIKLRTQGSAQQGRRAIGRML